MKREFGHVVIAISVCAFSLACKSNQKVEGAPAVKLPDRVQGATIRPVGDRRRGYGTEKATETMERLRAMGVNTISILMEGKMRSLEDREIRLPSDEDQAAIQKALLDAHRLGFATILIPHLYLDDGQWRGHIDPKNRDALEAWWKAYDRFMLRAADLARGGRASALSIGVELKALSRKADTHTRMEHLIDAVRERYAGTITYSANWDEAEDVVFWDVVDLAGVNGYYPLVPDPVRGAEAVARRLTALSDKAGRDVLVLEAGYRAGPGSHVRPWEWPEDVPDDDVDANAQAAAWAAVLATWLPAPGVRGLLIWVIPTDPDDPASEPPHGFNPMNRAAEQVIRRAFSGRLQPAS